jgi:AcrR family transcriptional regulator
MARAENTAETRAHILDVARREFFAKGYASASINAIVGATSVSKPTVYYHFKSKAALFEALVVEAFDRYIEHRGASVDPEASAADQIVEAIAADFRFCLEQPELCRFALAMVFALPEENPVDFHAILDRDHAVYREMIERGVERGELACTNPAEAALALQGTITINVMSFLKMGHPPEFLSAERARQIAAVLLAGFEQK